MKKIISTMTELKLRYIGKVWSLNKKKFRNKLERMQRLATKFVLQLKDLSYEERLKD